MVKGLGFRVLDFGWSSRGFLWCEARPETDPVAAGGDSGRSKLRGCERWRGPSGRTACSSSPPTSRCCTAFTYPLLAMPESHITDQTKSHYSKPETLNPRPRHPPLMHRFVSRPRSSETSSRLCNECPHLHPNSGQTATPQSAALILALHRAK